MKCIVVNLHTSNYDVYIGRAGKGKDGYFGNPFSVEKYGHGVCIDKFMEYFHDRLTTDQEFQHRVAGLVGKKLGCFCKPKSCHGDIIAEYVNSLGQERMVQGKLF